jgi:transposase
MRPFSSDLRERVAVSLRAGANSREVGERFGVSASFVRKLRALERKTGSVESRSPHHRGKARQLGPEHDAIVLVVVAELMDATLRELGREIARRTDPQRE